MPTPTQHRQLDFALEFAIFVIVSIFFPQVLANAAANLIAR